MCGGRDLGRGTRPERLQLEWISAAEGQKFAVVMRELDKLLRKVSSEEVEETMRILEEEERMRLEREAKKKAKAEAAAASS